MLGNLITDEHAILSVVVQPYARASGESPSRGYFSIDYSIDEKDIFNIPIPHYTYRVQFFDRIEALHASGIVLKGQEQNLKSVYFGGEIIPLEKYLEEIRLEINSSLMGLLWKLNVIPAHDTYTRNLVQSEIERIKSDIEISEKMIKAKGTNFVKCLSNYFQLEKDDVIMNINKIRSENHIPETDIERVIKSRKSRLEIEAERLSLHLRKSN